ncbi:glyoxylate/hydroxypyruvate reductase A [Phenylobacterium sp. LH3H17]|uniref:2-hydroxyacid dehydrogenase n=1 Tax=Phenylobacterium sp. LH3H17 TaxID=2903901 RepID=UPI0020C9CE45|nr:glyoxylate/hydroxypyruvate reductase A [Phenylobacterium sp. LH3H17]UTP41205.1 glyoxylate/hydroxypyruvate reductase A [Phenylobacterium sp. LH3H17]
MTIPFLSRLDLEATELWRGLLERALGEPVTLGLPDDRGAVEIAVVANPPPGELAALPNLKFIQSAWAGIDGLMDDPVLPRHVALARLIDPTLAAQMAEAVAAHVLALHRQAPAYAAQQTQGLWRKLPQPPTTERAVGLLGYGEMGKACGNTLVALGFQVSHWTRTSGDLDNLLAHSEIVVNLLPLTPQTRGILGQATFARMRPGAAIINVGRGGHLVEADLVPALDSGQLGHAVLDVFEIEPLPAGHPFWRHPKITITPHAAAITDPASGALRAAENIARFRAGQPVTGLVSFETGY